MSSVASTSFKLGLFVIVAVAGAVATALVLGMRTAEDQTVEYHSYFDESVMGLDVGAAVKLRGITIGAVDGIAFAPDARLVDVRSAIRRDAAPKLAWSPAHDTGLRAQLATQGLTGVKLVDVDVFDPDTHPPPPLTFRPSEHYVPATKSVLGQLVDRLPEIVDAGVAALHRIEVLFRELDESGLASRAGNTLDNLNLAIRELRGIVHRVDRGELPEKTAAALVRLDGAIDGFRHVIERIDGDAGLLSSTQRAADTVTQLGRRATGATENLDATIREMGDAARAVRDVADALDREPDMLLKGRKAKSPRER
jgi:phospholipid/cholesterol/gamma-HCH transport system substrate-binding protein